MCLNIVNRKGIRYTNKPRPFTAKKPIKVYKVLDGSYSPYRSFRWVKGYYYYEDEPLEVKGQFTLWNQQLGFFEQFEQPVSSNRYSARFSIERGLHAWQSKHIAYNSYTYHIRTNARIVEMIIPKGAKYFLGDDGDIVSDKILYV